MDYKAHYRERNKIIENLHKKEIDKKEFIMRTLAIYKDVNFLRLPNKFDSFESALYHYQFHNAKAKYYKSEYIEHIEKNRIYALECKAKSDSHYESKEEVTLALLKQFLPNLLESGSRVSAYYLNMNSKTLHKRLVEIVFHDMEMVILHSLDAKVVGVLSGRSLLESEPKNSVIDSYVNEKFY